MCNSSISLVASHNSAVKIIDLAQGRMMSVCRKDVKRFDPFSSSLFGKNGFWLARH
jgi:hypothetical protein